MPELGDFAVVRTGGWAAPWIRRITRSHYNHAVVWVGDGVVEATPSGAIHGDLGWTDLVWSTGKLSLTDAQREAIAKNALGLVGVGYNFLDILSVGLLQYGIRPKFLREEVSESHRLICSQLVDFAYLLSGVHLFNDGRIPMDVTPRDLARLIGA